MKSSLAEEMRPKTWDDYIGIPNTIAQLQHTIQTNNPRGGIMIWGPTGVGKTSLAKLIVTSWLCLNKEPKEFNPCGKCSVCLGLNTDNYYYYTPSGSKDTGDGKSSAQVIGEMISRSKQSPYYMDNKSGTFRQFLIINEMQLLSRATHNSLLDAIEEAPESTTWILTGMDTSTNTMDSEVFAALANRCLYIRIPQNTEDDIKNRLITQIPNLNLETAQAISVLSNKNMRKAWSNLAIFWPRIEAENITSEIIYDELGGGCSERSRRDFWRALALGNGIDITNTLNKWLSKTSSNVIKNLLINDLIINPNIFKSNSYIKDLGAALYTDLRDVPLVLIFLQYLGDIDLYNDKNINELNTEIENPIEINKDMQIADVIANELNKVLDIEVPLSGKKLKNKVYGLSDTETAFLTLTSLDKILEYYNL